MEVVRLAASLALASALYACAPDDGAAAADARAGVTSDAGGSSDAGASAGAPRVLADVRLPGTTARVDLELDRGKIAAIVAHRDRARAPDVVDLGGRFVAPAFIDAHVHLAYDPRPDELVRHGVAAAVDLAAPLVDVPTLARGSGLRVIAAGPMIAAPRGYPTQGWGRGGYGLECPTTRDATAAVDRVHAAGARLVKLSLGSGPDLDAATLRAVVARAHALGVKVAVHALGDASAKLAAEVGADLLAHTPVEPLSEETVALWSRRAVVSTLTAFGGSDATIDDLRRLRAAGATILYGTDLGNTSDAGIQAAELRALERAGLDGAAILEAGTKTPARWLGLEDLGEVAPGRAASLLVLDADPTKDPATLARPEVVYLDGQRR